MKRIAAMLVVALLAGQGLLGPLRARAADDAKVRAATRQVEEGARKIGQGQVLEGAGETARGIGSTVVEGARFTAEKLKEAGRAAEPPARSAWERVRDGARDVGRSVRSFFVRLLGD